MIVTREVTAQKIADYLHHALSIQELVDWAESVLLDEEFAAGDEESLRHLIGRLGVSDVKEFGLSWEDCERLLSELASKPALT